MLRFHFCGLAAVGCLGMFLGSLHVFPAIGQEKEIANAAAAEHFKIQVTAGEVRLDAVVLDKKGRPITDLSASDFEVFQDESPQEIVSSVYVTSQSGPGAPTVSRNLPQLPTPALERKDVRRTIIFVLDDVSMSYEHLNYARTALKNFVEKQMQPGDLVAILRTSYGNSALQMFLSDKKQVLARIDTMRWGTNAGFVSIKNKVLTAKDEENINVEHIDDLKYFPVYDNQLSTLSYSIRALKDMPGRKVVFMMTALPSLINPPPKYISDSPREPWARETELKTNYYNLYGNRFSRLADDALRAGVVVNSLDIRGVREFGDPQDPDRYYEDWANGLNPLPAKTGGVYVENSNFFVDGIGKEANNIMQGYYLLSYVPPATTFKANRKEIYHQIKIKVKRKGAIVHTRDGFYGKTESETTAATPKDRLIAAIFSPFRYTDLDVNLASGFIEDPNAGYLLRSWLHLDAKNVKIAKIEEGDLVNLEAVCLTSDIDGKVQDARIVKYTFRVKPENLEWVQEHGIRFSMLLPVKNPGSYYVRAAVRDAATGNVGSAYQFVAIPDLKKKGLALSNIFMITNKEDLDWIRSDTAKEVAAGEFFPVLRKDESRSPALRTYAVGDKLQSFATLYNADADAIARSGVEIQTILYKDGEEALRSDSLPIPPGSAGNPDRILLLQKVTLGSDLMAGDYVLQLLAVDKKNRKKKEGATAQSLSFSIADK